MKVIETFIVDGDKGTTTLYLLEDGRYMLDDLVLMSTGSWQSKIHFIEEAEALILIEEAKLLYGK